MSFNSPNHTYTVSLRLSSASTDFGALIPAISEYNTVYYKKGSSRFKDGTFKASANVLCVNDIFSCNVLDDFMEENSSTASLIEKLASLMKSLSVINTSDLRREFYISGTIESDQFGFGISCDLIFLLAEHKYSLSFSGISFSGFEEVN